MTTKDDEFNRIEMESKVRMMAVQYALRQIPVINIPTITQEEWDSLNAQEK